jgi:two-component system LytT family response regulator
MMKAVIVDDEIRGRQFLHKLLEKFAPDIKVCGEASNAEEAKEVISIASPDIVFLDIEMPGKSGIELLKEIKEINFEIIFATAFNQYAVEAFRLGAIDYLLKPISPDDLIRAIDRAKQQSGQKDQNKKKYETLKQQFGKSFTKITIPTTSGFEFIDFDEIIFMQSEGNYTNIRMKQNKSVLATRLLGEFEELLTAYNFFRIHKSYIINLGYMKKYTKGDGGVVTMHDGSEIDVSRRIKEAFLQRIKI